MQSAKFPQYTFQCFHVWLMFGNCSCFLSQKLMMVPISQAEFCQHNLSFKSNRYFFPDQCQFFQNNCPPLSCSSLFVVLFTKFHCTNHLTCLMIQKKQQQRKNVDFMDQLSLFCLSTTKHTHTFLLSVTKPFTCTNAHTQQFKYKPCETWPCLTSSSLTPRGV